MFSRLVSNLIVLFSNVPDVCYTESASLMSGVVNVVDGASGLQQYPPPYPVLQYISWYTSRFDACRVAMTPVGQVLVVSLGNGKCEKTLA